MKIKIFYFILIPLLFWGCLQTPDTIKDVRDLPQDHTAYLINATPKNDTIQNNTPQRDTTQNDATQNDTLPKEKFLLPWESQVKMNEDYDKIYFSVWHILQPAHASSEKLSLIFKKFAANPGFGENKKKHSAAWLKKLQQNASLETFPNALQHAITTRNTSLRMLPTQAPHFYSSEGDIAGWPFDNLQISSVTSNTPIIIFHLSADKSWALVETSFAFGWMPVEDYARVDDNFIKTWEFGRYAVVIRDKISIFDADGNFSLRTSIGQIFPLVNEMSDKLEILIATTDKNSYAVMKHGFVSRQVIAPKPLPFTYVNAVKIANELIDEPYGWGGLYGNRDCSAMTRDFFAPFGIWLPRHSEDQAKKVGIYTNLQNLDPEQKEKIILEQGIPYLSLLWRKGHIMLYIGEQNGRALIFHNVWGLKTRDFAGREGRKIIGKAVITTLYPGAELCGLDPQEGLLVKTISGLTVLMPEKQSQQTQQHDLTSQANGS